uniref:Neur_chan_memb domain-containing protein n=1 Tax=Ascaris lumbricoides TaxID=6252 RepID=A0A0M3I9H8_ASCLU
RRQEVKFECCHNNYTLLIYTLYLQRKPLFYLINLVTPTSVITLIAIVGFFSAPTVNGIREEKISLGITTLLSMSILILMVSDKMPSTSSFIPLIGWFYFSMIMLISSGTLAASLIIYTQKKGAIGKRPPQNWMRFYKWLGKLIRFQMPIAMKRIYKVTSKRKHSSGGMFIRNKGRQHHSRIRKKQLAEPVLLTITKSPDRPPIPTTIGDNEEEMKLIDVDEDEPPQTADSNMPVANVRHKSISQKSDSLSKETKAFYEEISTGIKRRNTTRHNVGMVRTGTTIRKNLHNCSRNLFAANVKNNGKLAEIEYDWIAAVIERCCFIVFFVLFLFTSFGINAIGLIYWYNVGDRIVQ